MEVNIISGSDRAYFILDTTNFGHCNSSSLISKAFSLSRKEYNERLIKVIDKFNYLHYEMRNNEDLLLAYDNYDRLTDKKLIEAFKEEFCKELILASLDE